MNQKRLRRWGEICSPRHDSRARCWPDRAHIARRVAVGITVCGLSVCLTASSCTGSSPAQQRSEPAQQVDESSLQRGGDPLPDRPDRSVPGPSNVPDPFAEEPGDGNSEPREDVPGRPEDDSRSRPHDEVKVDQNQQNDQPEQDAPEDYVEKGQREPGGSSG